MYSSRGTPCKAEIGSLSSFSIRSTCPNRRSLLFLIFSTTVSRSPSSSLVFFISGFFSSTSASDSPHPAQLCHQQSSLVLLSQAQQLIDPPDHNIPLEMIP